MKPKNLNTDTKYFADLQQDKSLRLVGENLSDKK